VLERFTWFKQSAFRYDGEGIVVYIDPWGVEGDVPADVIFVTHAHFDHYDPDDVARIRKPGTKLVAPRDAAREIEGEIVPVLPGESHEVGGIRFTTVPAYNTVEHRLDKHPKQRGWVGYVLELGGRTYYHSGDTDPAPELHEVRSDVSMVCIGGDPFTMGPDEAAGLVRSISPRLAVPMHYGFIVGRASFAEDFRAAADPVPVQALTPVRPFERP
jgi:L-ascorbate metabolism protein UlaG (beta-lactamase superfamily)